MTKAGDILRLRNFRDYFPDGKSWAEFSCGVIDPKTGRQKREKKEEKMVFVALLLGCEPLKLPDDMTPEKYGQGIESSLLELGYMPIDDAIAAGADPKKLKFELVDHSKDPSSKGQ